jgi:hypothetical protein
MQPAKSEQAIDGGPAFGRDGVFLSIAESDLSKLNFGNLILRETG